MIQQNTLSKTDRIFYNLLLRVGAIGKYQIISLIIWSALFMISSSIASVNPFLFQQTPYSCLDLEQKECQAYVCSLPPHQRSQFAQPKKQPSFIEGFGDYRCEKSEQINKYQTYIYLAGMSGVFMTVIFSSYIRKKILIQCSILILIASFCFILVADDLEVAVILLSINEACQTVVIELVVCFITETVLEEERGKQSMMLLIFYNVGSTLNCVTFYFLPWHFTIILYFVLPLSLILIGLIWYVKDPPLDLVANFSAEQIHRQLIFIARQNGKDPNQITTQQAEDIKDEYEEELHKKSHEDQFTVIDIFKFKSIRACVISCIFFHFCLDFNFFAPMISLSSFSSNIYEDGIIFGAASLLSAIACYFFINELPRKKMVIYSTVFSILLMAPLYFITKHHSGRHERELIVTCLIFLFRVANGVIFEAFVFIQNQIFPAQIRSHAILLTCFFSIFSKSIIPVVSGINERKDYAFFASFIIASVIMLLSMINIKETLGIPPPELIEELAYKHHQTHSLCLKHTIEVQPKQAKIDNV